MHRGSWASSHEAWDVLTSVAIKCIPEKLCSHQGPFYKDGLPLPDQLCGKKPLSLRGQRRSRMAIRRGRGQFQGSWRATLPHPHMLPLSRGRRVHGAWSAPHYCLRSDLLSACSEKRARDISHARIPMGEFLEWPKEGQSS